MRHLLLVLVLIGGCGAEATRPAVRLGYSPGVCHARGVAPEVLPDPVCTPGLADPVVTQENIHQTICVSGYAASVRPSSSYTTPLKAKQMIQYGYADTLADHEEDHLIPLELGGSPRDPANLWPEPDNSPNPKDTIEGRLKRAVCGGTVTLSAAQTAIALDWVHAIALIAAWCPPCSIP